MINTELLQRGVDGIILRTLAHFLWQATALGLLAAVSLRLLKNAPASARCSALTLCLLGMPVCASVTLLIIVHPSTPTPLTSSQPIDSKIVHDPSPAAQISFQEHADSPFVLHTTLPDTIEPAGNDRHQQISAIGTPASPKFPPPQPPAAPVDRWAPVIAAAYFTGVILMLLRLCLGVRSSTIVRANSSPATDAALLAAYSRQLRRTPLRQTPALLLCKRVLAPAVVGILKPAILLPVSICTDLSLDQIELLLAHELAHIRRHDQILDLIQRIIEAFFFFHPAVWYVSLEIRTEREKCCDDIVVNQGHSQLVYAGVLVRVAELSWAARSSPLLLAQSAAGRRSNLRHRILRLIGPAAPNDIIPSRTASIFLLAVVLLSAGIGIRLISARAAKAATPPTTMPTTKPASPFRITFDNGCTAEVLAVSKVPSRDKPFWTPDGKTIIPAPFASIDGGYKQDPGKPAFEITLRVSGGKDHPLVRAFAASPNMELFGPQAFQPNGADDLRVFDCPLPSSTDSIDLDLGVAANNWQLIQSFKTLGDYGDGPNKVSVVDVHPWEKNALPDRVQFRVLVSPTHSVLRLVAVDDAGVQHISTGSYSMGSDFYSIEAVFPDLPHEKVKEYRAEKCDYQWNHLKGIHLQPPGVWEDLVEQSRIARLAAQDQKFNPATDDARINQDIENIEHLSPFDKTSDAWVTAIRDLSDIGAPAVPALISELRHTGRPYERSGLAMALRAIDDPRSVPGLIAALADCPYAPNDYGGQRTSDPALTHFMLSIQDTDRQFNPRSLAFDFGRPVTEIKMTLNALTENDASPKPIFKDQRSVYQAAAKQWTDWWEKNKAPLTRGLPPLRSYRGSSPPPLQLALVEGRIDDFKKLIDGGADVNSAATDGWTPLHIAAALGRLDAVQYLLDHHANPDLRTADGCTLLHVALGLGISPIYGDLPPDPKIEIIQLLLDHNADVHAANTFGQTPLYGAAAFDDPDLIQLLLTHGAPINAKDNHGRTALHRAVQCERALTVDALLRAGADVNAKDLTDRTPIRMSSMSLSYPKYNSPIVQQLLDHGAEASIKTVIVLGNVDQLAAALKKNPPLNEKPAPEDRSPLDWAIAQSPEKVQLLLNAGADPNGHEADGNTPLHMAMFRGDPQIVSMLIAAKADVNAPGQEDQPPIFWACIQLKADLVDLLLNAGAKAGVCGVQYKSNPISLALQGITDQTASGSAKDKTSRAKRIILALLAHGSDINEAPGNALPPIFGQSGEMGEFLLEHGAKLDMVDEDGNTPLHYAAVLSNIQAVRFLLDHHVPLESRNKKSETPLLRCVGFAPRNGVVKLLLDAGADVTATDSTGNTPLHLAVQKIHNSPDRVVEQLLAKGADSNAKDRDGLTPLHIAARMGSDPVIQLLLQHGADISAADNGGRTPIQWATQPSTIALLRSHGATTAPAK